MLNPKVFFNKGIISKSGESNIYLVVHVDYKTVKVTTGIKCKPAEWDTKSNRIKGQSEELVQKYLLIERRRSELSEIKKLIKRAVWCETK